MKTRLALASFLLALLPSVAFGQAKPETLSDSWFVIKVAGKPAGHSHERRVRRADGARTVIETTSTLRLVIARDGSRNEVSEDESAVETEDGQPIRFEKKSQFSARPSLYKGSIDAGKLTLVTSIGGSPDETRVLDWDKDSLLDEGTRLRVLSKIKEKGARFSFKTFSTSRLDCTPTEGVIIGPETIEVGGQKIETVKFHMSHETVEQDQWIDANGTAYRMAIDLGGLVVHLERSTQEEAESDEVADGAWTLAMWNRADSPLPNARAVESLTVRIQRDAGLAKWVVPTTSQAVLERDEHSVTLRVTKHFPEKAATLPMAATPELAPLLTPEPFIQSDDPVIVAKAKELRGTETDSLKVARAIAGFVQKHITKKDYDTGYASAKEAYERREGDCTEHAVLLVALLRAAGIPAQLCGGFIASPSGSFGGHAWGSAWVGEWVDLDATLGDAVADAARIKVDEGRSDRKSADKAPALGLGQLAIQIRSFTIAGKTVAVKPLVATGLDFDASALGVSFKLDPTKVWTFKADPGKALAVITDGKKTEIQVGYEELPATVSALTLEKAYGELLKRPIHGTTTACAGHERFEVGADATGAVVSIRIGPSAVLQFVFKSKKARRGVDEVLGTLKLPPVDPAEPKFVPAETPPVKSEPAPAK